MTILSGAQPRRPTHSLFQSFRVQTLQPDLVSLGHLVQPLLLVPLLPTFLGVSFSRVFRAMASSAVSLTAAGCWPSCISSSPCPLAWSVCGAQVNSTANALQTNPDPRDHNIRRRPRSRRGSINGEQNIKLPSTLTRLRQCSKREILLVGDTCEWFFQILETSAH